VVVKHQPKRLGRATDPLGHGYVGLRWRGIARRVVVHEDQGRGVDLQRALHNLSRVDGHMVDGTACLFLIRDQDVLAVQIQDAKLFGFPVGHGGVAIVQQRRPTRQDGTVDDPRARHPLCRGFDHLQFDYDGLTHPRHRAQPRDGRGDDAVEIAECIQKRAGKRFYVLPGDGTKQHQLQQLVIWHGLGAALHEPRAQPGAMVADIGWQPPPWRKRLPAPFVGGKKRQGRVGKGARVGHGRRVRNLGEQTVNGCVTHRQSCPLLDSTGANPYLGAVMAQKSDPNYKIISENRRARFDYAIESDLECGIILLGSEVKSLRTGQANIAESYANVENGELWLINSYIAPYLPAKTWGHEERRKRKLLVSKRDLARFWAATAKQGMTLVPLVMYFNDRGLVKLKIGVAKGKKNHDKRETEAKRDWARQKQRLLKEN